MPANKIALLQKHESTINNLSVVIQKLLNHKESLLQALTTGVNTPLPSMDSLYGFMSADFLAHRLPYALAKLLHARDSVDVFDEDGVVRAYNFYKVPTTTSGLVCHILHSKDQNNPRVHITFRGTNPAEIKSVARNLEATPGRAPGCKSLIKNKHEILFPLNQILLLKKELYGANEAYVTFSGHSLAGGDAKNEAVIVMNALTKELESLGGEYSALRSIKKITINHVNGVGIYNEMAQEAVRNAHILATKYNVEIKVRAILVAGDAIQQVGEPDDLFSDIDSDVVDVGLLKVKDQVSKLLNANSSMLIGGFAFLTTGPFAASVIAGAMAMRCLAAHKRHIFTGDGGLDLGNFEFYSNDSLAGRLAISKKLCNKFFARFAFYRAPCTPTFESNTQEIDAEEFVLVNVLKLLTPEEIQLLDDQQRQNLVVYLMQLVNNAFSRNVAPLFFSNGPQGVRSTVKIREIKDTTELTPHIPARPSNL